MLDLLGLYVDVDGRLVMCGAGNNVLCVSLNKKGDTHTEHIVTSTTHDKTTINVNIQTKQIQHVNQDSNRYFESR